MSEFGEIFKVRCGWWRSLRLKKGQAGTELTEAGGMRGDTGDGFGAHSLSPQHLVVEIRRVRNARSSSAT